MDQALDLVERRPLAADRPRLVSEGAADWVRRVLGHDCRDPALFERALTHASRDEGNYERLEFLGDRVLGLAIADTLYALFPNEPEGRMSWRLNALVSRSTCSEIARDIGVPKVVRLGKQAREDGAQDSDNVLGDVVEALIGAIFLEAGFEAARAGVRRLWGDRIGELDEAPKHPKSTLQERAAAAGWGVPDYQVASRKGPPHAPSFVVRVTVRGAGEAEAEGTSKQEAETAAAQALLSSLEGPAK